VATALNYGHVDLDDFTEERIKNSEILRFMDRISFREDPDLTRLYPQKWPSRVEIAMTNGERHEGYCEYPKGDPENPLSEKELTEKFHKLCGDIISRDEKDRIIELALNLEKLDDIAGIFQG